MALFDTHIPMPDGTSAQFITELQNWFQANDAARFADMFEEFVVSGGLHGLPSPAGITSPVFGFEAYDSGGNYILQEPMTITYSGGGGDYWVIGTGDTDAVNAGWTRELGTHVMWQVAATQPALPPDSVWLMKVTVGPGGAAILVVEDISVDSPIRNLVEMIVEEFATNDPGFLNIINGLIITAITTNPTIAAFITSLINGILANTQLADGNNLGPGQGQFLFSVTGNNTLNFRTALQGNNMTIGHQGDTVRFDSRQAFFSTGGGVQLFDGYTAADGAIFRSLTGIGGTTVTNVGGQIQINAASGVGDNVAWVGTQLLTPGVSIISGGTGPVVNTMTTTAQAGSRLFVFAKFQFQFLGANASPYHARLRFAGGGTVLDTSTWSAENNGDRYPIMLFAQVVPGTNQAFQIQVDASAGPDIRYVRSSLMAFQLQ